MPHEPNQLSSSKTESASVVPGPKRFCLSKITKTIDVRWSFSTRYFDELGRKVHADYSADTQVEIENRRVSVVNYLRGKGLILCDCGCNFMQHNT